MFDSILIVCTGNICRSPTGERIMRSLLPSKKIDSAGVGALIDKPADSSAELVARMHGITLENHKGRQLTSHMARQYDLILVMENSHAEQVYRLVPEARGKTLLIGHWLNKREIPDPYRQAQEAFEYVYLLLEQACQSWVEKLSG